MKETTILFRFPARVIYMVSMARRTLLLTLLCCWLTSTQSHSPPAGAKVYFANLSNGETVTNPIHIQFGIQDFGITPAGTKGKIRHTAGHHHLLINLIDLPPLDEPIPRTKNHIHFDQGETETVLELTPGKHTLQLLLGDEDHEPHDPPLYSDRITIFVTEQ